MTVAPTAKRCSTCQLIKSTKHFGKNSSKSDGLQTVCKDCKCLYNRAYYATNSHKYVYDSKRATRKRERRQATLEFIFAYLQKHPCADCNESDPIVLQFDHQHNKIMSIAEMITQGSSINRIKDEMDKCEVVCANCHTKRTAIQSGWWRVKFVERLEALPERIPTAVLPD